MDELIRAALSVWDPENLLTKSPAGKDPVRAMDGKTKDVTGSSERPSREVPQIYSKAVEGVKLRCVCRLNIPGTRIVDPRTPRRDFRDTNEKIESRCVETNDAAIPTSAPGQSPVP